MRVVVCSLVAVACCSFIAACAAPAEGEGEGEGEGEEGEEGEGEGDEGEGEEGEGDEGEGEGEGDGDVVRAEFPKGSTWQITLIEPPTVAEAAALDVFAWDLDLEDTGVDVIDALHDHGTKVICYFSAGTFEPFRADADAFPDEVKGNRYEEDAFADELYLDVRDPRVLAIMLDRLDAAVAKGCDAVDPDNVNIMDVDNGFALTAADVTAYDLALVDAAHDRGLAVGLKNLASNYDDVAGVHDFAVNESCTQFDECGDYRAAFLDQNKAVFHIEYEGELADICAVSEPLGLSTLKKNLELDAPFETCPR